MVLGISLLNVDSNNQMKKFLSCTISLAHVKNQHNFRIVCEKIIENISNNLNNALESFGFSPSLRILLFISKNAVYFNAYFDPITMNLKSAKIGSK